jgi:argininosuccinate lyase
MTNESDASSYTASISYDRRLYRQDIAGSVAHTRMLANAGIISDKEAESIVMGLSAIRQEIEDGSFPWREELEDVHMNIEARLFERIGDVAGKLHTGRSRNDQVVTDMRLYCKEVTQKTLEGIKGLLSAFLAVAEANSGVIMPGYTHLQRAQPVLFSHHMLAYFHMLQRDRERFRECFVRTDVLPLGSGALAGVPYPIDREFLARDLGFSRISQNSMDAVSDRDFLVEYHAASAICMMHISRLAEEMVLWSSQEFDFIRLDEAYTTGSSIMPQKRNPDFAELARGRTGRVYGHLVGILTLLKGLPLTYNRDLQEDKEGFFDTVDTLLSTLDVLAGMVGTLLVNAQRTSQAARDGYILATDLADYLVKKGEPFRSAHGIVRELTSYAISQGKGFAQLELEEYRRFSLRFQEDVYAISPDSSIASRDVPGGTGPKRVEEAIKEARRLLEGNVG